MPKAFYNMNDFSGGLNDAVDPRDIGENELSDINNAVMDKRRSIRPMGGDVDHSDVPSDTAGHITPGYGAFVFESDHENVPALAPTFGANKLAFSQAGSNDTIVDDDSTFVTLGFQAGDIISITGCTDTTANNLAGLTIKSLTVNTITLEEDGVFTNETNEAGTVTVTRIGGGLDTGEEWLAVMDAKTATVDLYDLKGDAFTAGAINLGTVTSKTYSNNNLAFNDNSGSSAKDTIVSDTGVTTFISSGFRKGDILGIAGCDDEDKANNLNAVRVFNVANHTLTLDHSGLVTTDANESGTPAITKLTQGVFYFADEAVRVADASFGAATEPYWYGYVKRQHFGTLRLTANTRFKNWYSNTNGLAAPTELDLHASSYPTYGTGFDVTIADVTSGGTYGNTAGTLVYQIASTFIYDGNQESLLSTPASSTHTPGGANYALSVSVRATAPYDERISGGRIYIRKNDTDDPWALLMDIDLADGVRAKLSGDYTAWTLNSGDEVYVNTVKSLSPNLETYEILNGFLPDEKKISISGVGEGYKAAVVANRRCFVANVKTQNEEGQTLQMRDRIMYTPIGKFDTFPRSYFIDVVKGDAEEFNSLQEFSDRLLAFKDKKMYIINIASPSPSNWYVEDIKDFVGVEHPYATTKTEFGIAWCNKFGVYLYDGREVRNILLNRIDETTWQAFFQRDTLIGYNPKKYYLVILKDAFASAGDVYVYDFRTNSWTYGQSAFGDNFNRTNMVPDWNGNMITVYSNKSTGDLVWNGVNTNWDDMGGGNDWEAVADAYNVKEWSDALRDVATTKFSVITKDIDFGEPGRKKKVYGITLTYKSDNDQTQPIYYDTDGGTSFSSQLTGDFTGTGTGWKQVRAKPSNPISCQSIRFKILNPSNATGTSEGVQINDMAVEYRPLYTRVS